MRNIQIPPVLAYEWADFQHIIAKGGTECRKKNQRT